MVRPDAGIILSPGILRPLVGLAGPLAGGGLEAQADPAPRRDGLSGPGAAGPDRRLDGVVPGDPSGDA